MRRPAQLAHRFIQHTGGLAIPSVVLAELCAGAYKQRNPPTWLPLIADLLQEVMVLDIDSGCAERFGRVWGALLVSKPFSRRSRASWLGRNRYGLMCPRTDLWKP